jgi:hypothetical protein
MIEDKLIAVYEQEIEEICTDFKRCGQDVTSQECKKCESGVLSEGLLRRHKVTIHKTH